MVSTLDKNIDTAESIEFLLGTAHEGIRALAFWQAVTVDEAGFLEDFVHLLREREVRFCVIGGQAVNAYVEPVVSLDLDLVVAADHVELLARVLAERAAADTSRRPSKRQKDLADIGRILEARPNLRSLVPEKILDRLF